MGMEKTMGMRKNDGDLEEAIDDEPDKIKDVQNVRLFFVRSDGRYY